ncbi:MAG: hypothetical protein ACTSU2_08410 [Promethearchaeota archaeon]
MINEMSPEKNSDKDKVTKVLHYKDPPCIDNPPKWARPVTIYHISRYNADDDENPWLANPPRLGRRENEPQSIEITRICDILKTNFKDDRTMCDLHYYFEKDGEEYDIQFDISYFKRLKIDYTLSFYDAKQYKNLVPTMVINILSKNMYMMDFSVNRDTCQFLQIPIYIVFSAFDFGIKIYSPPFLRAYILKEDGDYNEKTLREEAYDEEGNLREDKLIDLRPHLPFKIGLIKTERKHQNGTYNYDLLLLNAETLEIYKTSLEIYKTRLEQEREKRLEAESEAQKAKSEAEKERAMRIKAEEEIKKLKEALSKLKNKN